MYSLLRRIVFGLHRHPMVITPVTRLVLTGTLICLPFAIQLDAAANTKTTTTTTSTDKAASKAYYQAKTELPGDLYPYYRLLDRIMSANPGINQQATIGLRSLDESSCRKMLGDSNICTVATELPDVNRQDHFMIWALQVAAATSGAPNAFAQSRNNRIVINRSLDQVFGNDIEAKACVVAHEMAHLQEDHSKKKMVALAQLNVEAAGKIRAAVRNAQSANQSNQFWNTLTIASNAASAGLNASAGDIDAANRANMSNQLLVQRQDADNARGRALMDKLYKQAQGEAPEIFESLKTMDGLPASLVARTMKDVNIYLSKVNDQLFALSREHEHEADSLAVKYLANAGINPEGCLRVIAGLHRGQYQPIAAKDDTHPGEQERIQAINQAIEVNAAAIRRGKAQLVRPAPLDYHYDPRLEVVTLYPGQSPTRPVKPNIVDVDGFLGK